MDLRRRTHASGRDDMPHDATAAPLIGLRARFAERARGGLMADEEMVPGACGTTPHGQPPTTPGVSSSYGEAPSPSAPRKRGRRRGVLTKTQELLLAYIASETVLRGGARCTKRELASMTGRNVKTIDRCMSDLRRRGLVEAQTCFDERGGQLSNTYRAVFRPLS